VDFHDVEVRAQSFYGTSPYLRIEESAISQLSMGHVDAAKIELMSSHFAGRVSISNSKVVHLVFSLVDVTRYIMISDIQWQRFPPRLPGQGETGSGLYLDEVSAGGLKYAGAVTSAGGSLPDSVGYRDNSFGTVFLGDDPLALLGKTNQQQPETVLDLYALTAKTYTARGRQATARQLYYERDILEDEAEQKRTQRFDVLRWISRVAVGYGYYPERGLLLLSVFVVLGWPIFATGERRLTGAIVPRSWLVFSLDTMIPILVLDPKTAEVSFSGFRQYYLYFMRLLGAGLAFLVLAYLKQAFIGPE
jgi:hypothetical protein